MDVSDARRLKTLEDAAINPERVYAVNARLKKLLAKQMLDNATLKDVAAKKWWRPMRSGRRWLMPARCMQ
jgi:putative transposase